MGIDLSGDYLRVCGERDKARDERDELVEALFLSYKELEDWSIHAPSLAAHERIERELHSLRAVLTKMEKAGG